MIADKAAYREMVIAFREISLILTTAALGKRKPRNGELNRIWTIVAETQHFEEHRRTKANTPKPSRWRHWLRLAPKP